MADTNTQIDVEDDGSVSVAGVSEEGMNKAIAYIEGLTKVVTAGEIYEGEVVRIMNFGAFVNILPGKDGMVHVSDMAEGYVNDANDVVKIGDKVQVRVKEVDEMGRINLSMRMDPSTDKPKEERRSSSGDRGNSRGGRPQRGGGFNRGGRSSGGFFVNFYSFYHTDATYTIHQKQFSLLLQCKRLVVSTYYSWSIFRYLWVHSDNLQFFWMTFPLLPK